MGSSGGERHPEDEGDHQRGEEKKRNVWLLRRGMKTFPELTYEVSDMKSSQSPGGGRD